jgi:hypothetical protein
LAALFTNIYNRFMRLGTDFSQRGQWVGFTCRYEKPFRRIYNGLRGERSSMVSPHTICNHDQIIIATLGSDKFYAVLLFIASTYI